MCDAAYQAILGTLRLSCAMELCSLALILHSGPFSSRNYALYRAAMELANSPAGLLILASIASVILEEKSLD